ncbi:MAG: tol-pal system protein YbgF [Oceanospirillaceae bacterium]|nr:tol-pal system protein YbgF [Oceanospirillaceae bacterium]
MARDLKALPLVFALALPWVGGAKVLAADVTPIPVTDSSAGSGASYAQSPQSELLLMVQQLQEEVRQLRGQLETQQYRLDKMEREQRDRYRDIDRRISALIQAAAGDQYGMAQGAADSEVPAQPDATENAPPEQAGGEAPAAVSSSIQPAVDGVSDLDAYKAAFALVRERQFEQALGAFDQFIQRYPQSNHLANAHYWVGEVQLAQQGLEQARTAFKRVLDQFPDHTKVPDALYKLGVVEDRLGNGEASKAAFSRLLTDFPQSSAAGLARNYTPSS